MEMDPVFQRMREKDVCRHAHNLRLTRKKHEHIHVSKNRSEQSKINALNAFDDITGAKR